MTDDVKAILAKQLIKQNISVSSLPSIVLLKAGFINNNVGIKNPLLSRLEYIIKTIFRYLVSY